MHIHLILYGRLWAFANLRKATIGFVIILSTSIRSSAWNNSDHIDSCFKFAISVFWKSVEKIQFWLKSDKNNKDWTRTIFTYI